MAYPAKAVANYFLDLAKRDGESLNPMKVQKLVYFAHGWCLTLNDTPLIEERFEAWKYGPVVPDLYRALKSWGGRSIESPIRASRVVPKPTGGFAVRFTVPAIGKEPDDPSRVEFIKALIDAVWLEYKGYSAIQLSNATHAPGSPWAKTREIDPSGNGVIDDLLIKADFQRRRTDAGTVAVTS